MLGLWYSNLFSQRGKSLRKYLQSHRTNTFRELLIAGILLLIVGVGFLLPVFENHREYDLWLAGFTATLALSFVFAILSAQINGYRRYKDTALGFATAMMFLLSGVLVLTGLFHL
jgi:uncharacterized membrane protein HdeD (DUF308 family)